MICKSILFCFSSRFQLSFYVSFQCYITVPPLGVEVTTDVSTPLIEGTYIDLVCNVSIHGGENTNITVSVQWSRDGTTINNGPQYTISAVELVSGNNYSSTVRIEELATSDSNAVFTCSVNVTPSADSTFTTGSEGTGNITITVRGLLIDTFTINDYYLCLCISEFMTSDIVLALDIPSVPTAGDQFNVTCSATVPERLVDRHEPTTFAISYDSGGQQKVSVNNPDTTQTEVLRDGNVFSKVVTIDPVKTSDARRYYCLVAFDLPLSAPPASTNNDLKIYSE